MSSSNEVSDQFAIRNLIETYADAVFRRDAEAWGATWAQDATWHLMGNTVAGRAAIVGAWSEAMKGFKFVAFFSQPGPIQINGNVATGRVYTNEVLVDQTDRLFRLVGRYEDTYQKINGAWLFQTRNYTPLQEH